MKEKEKKKNKRERTKEKGKEELRPLLSLFILLSAIFPIFLYFFILGA